MVSQIGGTQAPAGSFRSGVSSDAENSTYPVMQYAQCRSQRLLCPSDHDRVQTQQAFLVSADACRQGEGGGQGFLQGCWAPWELKLQRKCPELPASPALSGASEAQWLDPFPEWKTRPVCRLQVPTELSKQHAVYWGTYPLWCCAQSKAGSSQEEGGRVVLWRPGLSVHISFVYKTYKIGLDCAAIHGWFLWSQVGC